MNPYALAADGVVIIHFLFVLFVVFGALLVLRWRWLAALHLPAVIWVLLLEFNGWICPLTPLENDLRDRAGRSTYDGGFIDRYLMPILYPPGLTPELQWLLGGGVLLINGLIYGLLIRRLR